MIWRISPLHDTSWIEDAGDVLYTSNGATIFSHLIFHLVFQEEEISLLSDFVSQRFLPWRTLYHGGNRPQWMFDGLSGLLTTGR